MRVIFCAATNFASYDNLEFSLSNQGLTLIQGNTGSGKSTLCDIVPWTLFGRTAKDGAADDVISWGKTGPTKSTVYFYLNESFYGVTRIRGKKANDLYYFHGESPGDFIRGKDLGDTQKIINCLLGFDGALYLSGAYYHEFSQTAQFFVTNANNRRLLCEQLVDLSLSKKLYEVISVESKQREEHQKKHAKSVQLYEDRVQFLSRNNDYADKAASFDKDKAAKLSSLQARMKAIKTWPSDYYDAIRTELLTQIHNLKDETCSHCGSRVKNEDRDAVEQALADLKQEQLKDKWHAQQYADLANQYKQEGETVNTYAEQLDQLNADLAKATASLKEAKKLYAEVSEELLDRELLLNAVRALRGVAIQRTIQELEDKTNEYLTENFDAEIKVEFKVASADKLDVVITKDGHNCAYSQLSKGQRCLLKLCFGASVMQSVTAHHGISFNALFFDESLDGLDDRFKVKAYGLLKTLSLSYDSIFVVEHSEAFKTLFDNKYVVELINGTSQIKNEQS